MVNRSGLGDRTIRRLLGAGALVTTLALVATAVMISSAPSTQPGVAISVSKAVVSSAPASVQSAWAKLTPAEQDTLQPLRAQWVHLGLAAKAHWIQVADRLNGRPSRSVARAAQRMAAWQQLSPAERARARLHYKMASRLSPEERERRWKSYQASLHATPKASDESRRVLTVATPSTSMVERGVTTQLVTGGQPGVPQTMHVRALQDNAPAPSAASGVPS